MKYKKTKSQIVLMVIVIGACLAFYYNICNKKIDYKQKSYNSINNRTDSSSDKNTKDINIASKGSENSKIKEEKKLVIGEKKISLVGEQAVIGMKVQFNIMQAGKEEYKDAVTYQLFENDQPISPQSPVNSATLMMAAKSIGDSVIVKLYNSNNEEIKKFNIKIDQMQ